MFELELWMAYALTVLIFAALLALTWAIPRGDVFADAPDHSRWRDLRLWASALVALELCIYYIFS